MMSAHVATMHGSKLPERMSSRSTARFTPPGCAQVLLGYSAVSGLVSCQNRVLKRHGELGV